MRLAILVLMRTLSMDLCSRLSKKPYTAAHGQVAEVRILVVLLLSTVAALSASLLFRMRLFLFAWS